MAMREERAARRAHDRQRAPAGRCRRAIRARRLRGARPHQEHTAAGRSCSDFSTRIVRGDRIGLIGPNGAGKTTLLRLLVGELAPDDGEGASAARTCSIAYFDQNREQLDPDRTVVDTVADGNDTVTIGGVTRHVHGYLEDFLFPPERARSPVRSLSGGERNRLLLARLLTQPANVLDARRADERSRHRDARTGRGRAGAFRRHAAGRQPRSPFPEQRRDQHARVRGRRAGWRSTSAATTTGSGSGPLFAAARAPAVDAGDQRPPRPPSPPAPAPRPRLSYREKKSSNGCRPNGSPTLEAELARLEGAIASPDFYKETRTAIDDTLARVEATRRQIDISYQRWDELDSRER